MYMCLLDSACSNKSSANSWYLLSTLEPVLYWRSSVQRNAFLGVSVYDGARHVWKCILCHTFARHLHESESVVQPGQSRAVTMSLVVSDSCIECQDLSQSFSHQKHIIEEIDGSMFWQSVKCEINMEICHQDPPSLSSLIIKDYK